MFLRRCRSTKRNGERVYWELVESYRTQRGPRQRVVAYLGDVGSAKRAGALYAAKNATGWQSRLFDDEGEPEWVEVDTRRVRVEGGRDFGGSWLGLMRLCEPSSELRIAEHLYERSVLTGLLGIPEDKVNDDRLYRALDRLLPHKVELEKHLKGRLGELFDLEYDLLLYDVTSTYFEGASDFNGQAQRGYSRDHRPDCKQVCIALVVSREGVPLGD